MYAQIIVPLNGQDRSARALIPGLRLAAASDAPLRVVGVAPGDVQIASLRQSLEEQLAEAVESEQPDVQSSVVIHHEGEAWQGIVDELEAVPGSLICMASRGRRRTASLCGSTVDAVLRQITTPLLLVGPSVDVQRFDLSSPILVCVDGSSTSESILPIAASWSIAFRLGLTVATVMQPSMREAREDGDALVDSAYVHWVADKLAADTGREVDYDVLHSSDVAGALIDHARVRGVSAIAAATHGHTGLHRVTAGSVTATLIRRAEQPVLTYRPLALLR